MSAAVEGPSAVRGRADRNDHRAGPRSLRFAKGLVEKLPRSRRYRLPAEGYSVCLIFLKLFERVYAPLAAGLLLPVPGDTTLAQSKRSNLDRLYQRVADDLADLVRTVGLKFSSQLYENKILVEAPITA